MPSTKPPDSKSNVNTKAKDALTKHNSKQLEGWLCAWGTSHGLTGKLRCWSTCHVPIFYHALRPLRVQPTTPRTAAAALELCQSKL